MTGIKVESVEKDKFYCLGCEGTATCRIDLGGELFWICDACRAEFGGLLSPAGDDAWKRFEEGYNAAGEQCAEVFEELRQLRLHMRLVQARVTEMFRRPELYQQQREWALERGLL